MALLVLPVYLWSVVLLPYAAAWYRGTDAYGFWPILAGVAATIAYVAGAVMWCANPKGTKLVIKIGIGLVNVIVIGGVLLFASSCNGC